MVALNTPANTQTPSGWGLLPAALICDSKIKDGAIRLYAFLATRCYDADKRDRNVLTRKEIATQLEISESTVTNRVRELVERDWLLVWEVGRSNAYMTFKTTDECRQTRDANPDRAYVIFDKVPDLRVTRVNVDKGNQLPHSRRTKRPAKSSHIVQPVRLTEVTSSLGSDNQLHHSKHISLIQNKKEINTDSSNELSPADAGRGDQPKQPHGMVSNHLADTVNMVTPESQTDGVLVESIEETPNPVPLPPSPARVTVNAHNTTIVEDRDPIFDSVALLQFGIADTSHMPMKTTKTGKKRSEFGGRIGAIVKVIVDTYKRHMNVVALSPHEREGLARHHAKFWIWYTEVKYPPKGNEPPPQLRDADKFAEYWLEYRTYRNAPKAELPKPDVIPIARVGITTELPKAGKPIGGA